MMRAQLTQTGAIQSSSKRWWLAPQMLALAILVVLAWVAAGTDYYDRHYGSTANAELIGEYGWSVQNALYMTADGSKLSDYADKYKLLFIARTSFSNVDRMTDPLIAKSISYTITPGPIALSILAPKLRANVGQMNMVEFDLVVLPNQFSPDQISTLADVQRLGGKILETRGKSDVLVHPPETPQPAPNKS